MIWLKIDASKDDSSLIPPVFHPQRKLESCLGSLLLSQYQNKLHYYTWNNDKSINFEFLLDKMLSSSMKTFFESQLMTKFIRSKQNQIKSSYLSIKMIEECIFKRIVIPCLYEISLFNVYFISWNVEAISFFYKFLFKRLYC